ncbi:NUC173 domain-containing protein [Mycotypha africana]|uniref:NUC173 domain-containing protein n=1 Tax=Mycotypha africana TaxID=64632 RepID=UPI0022FFE9F3|nr:NUC173 domain-containing protein [Mycotypha africana]KAI8979642.1 NUC173 domain-containing protein [Mycotypha africana]
MMTTLQSSKGSAELVGALLYLLDEIFPYLPHSVLRSKFAEIIGVIEPTYEEHKDEQPIVRSIIGCLQELLAAQDGPNWSMPLTKKAYQQLLILSANASPKARKRAQDAIRSILSRPPPPVAVHPAADMTADFILRVLHEASKSNQHAAQQMLALLQMIVPYWPSHKFYTLCQSLLQLPKFNNIFLTKASFDVFEALFDAQETDMDNDKFVGLLLAICELKPAAVDERLLPPWLLIVAKAFPAYAKMSPAQCANDISTVFKLIFNDFQQESGCYRQLASCLSTLTEYCITDDLIEQASTGETNSLTEMIELLENGLGVHYQPAWIHVMTVQQAMFNKLNHYAAPLMNGCLALLGELRLSPSEAYKEQLDKTLGMAISTMGPEYFLQVLPLNLENNSQNQVGRAFLLPLLKTYTTNTTLSYFVNVLIPLGDRLAQKAEAAAARELEMQAKVYETLVNQIWSLAPGFCDLPTDLTRAFNDQVAERFSSLLYTQPDLRPTIAQALQLLIEKNQALIKSSADDVHLMRAYGLTRAQAQQNLEFMSKFAVNYLAVFFNVFSQIAPMFRGFMADVIKTYLTITPAADINATFKKVLTMLSQALETKETASNDPTEPAPMSHTMLDLAIIMIPFLDAESAELLYNGTTQQLLNQEEDATLQKKGYKVLNHLFACPHGRQVAMNHMDALLAHLLEATAACTISAKKDRIKTINAVVALLPKSDLHFIPAVLSEVVIASKDNNEKTRMVAFDTLVAMGEKMKEGGIVKTSKLDGFDPSTPDAEASINEYFTMVTAGLAGTTAHMISATVGVLSRIFFEFRDDIPDELASELLQTINMLAASNNREIVKAAIGYVKVCIVTLDISLLQPQVGEIVRSLIECQHQHRSHFKVKVRHLFERLIRRFGYDAVAEFVPEEDKKLVVNIQKRRLRAKRKKNAAAAGQEESDVEEEDELSARAAAKKGAFQDAYEEVLYGSDSDIDEDDSDEEGAAEGDKTSNLVKAAAKALNERKTAKTKKLKAATNAFIREDDEEGPLDFLDRSALGRISSSKPAQRKAKKNNKEAFAKGDDGRLIINEPTTQKGGDEEVAEAEEDYYMQHVTNPDGFVRDKRNRIKFKKGKDATENAMELDDDEDQSSKKQKRPKKQFEKIGKEFRSKKAGGDVKRKGQADPYSYIPLNKVIKKKGRRDQRLTFTGRVKK